MFRFTIRDVLWLMVVAGILCAWWIDRTKSQRERAVLMQSHANLQELRQMVGGDKGLDEFIQAAKAINRAPASRPSAIVVNLPSGSKPATGPQPPKSKKPN